MRFGLKSNNASYSRGLNLHWTEVKLELFGWVLSFNTTCIITVKFKGLRFNEKTLRTVGKSFAPLRSFDHCKKAWCVNMFLPFFFYWLTIKTQLSVYCTCMLFFSYKNVLVYMCSFTGNIFTLMFMWMYTDIFFSK